LAVRDLDLLSGSGEDDSERLEARDLAALAAGGEAEADRFARDLVLRTGETEEACADFRLLGLSGDMEADLRSTRLRSRESTSGEADRLLPSLLPLDTSLGGVPLGDS